jgi:hypothetical protein
MKLIEESKILENKKLLNFYPKILQEAKERINWINKNKSDNLLHIFELEDEEDGTSKIEGLEIAILRAFLGCIII